MLIDQLELMRLTVPPVPALPGVAPETVNVVEVGTDATTQVLFAQVPVATDATVTVSPIWRPWAALAVNNPDVETDARLTEVRVRDGSGLRIRYCPFPCGLWQDVHSSVTLGPAPVPLSPLPQATPGSVSPWWMAMCDDVTSLGAV